MDNKTDNTLYILSECAIDPDDVRTEIINESSIDINGEPKKFITIDTVLQSFEVLNWNQRIYGGEIVMTSLDNDGMIQNDLQKGQWIGEYGHPLDLSPRRQMIIYPPYTSHRILSYRREGNLLAGIVQTLANDMGTQMMNTTLQGVPAAFSLRSLGSVDMSTRRVKAPLKIICYDSVIRPSHIEAYQREILTEAAMYVPTSLELKDIITESAICEPITESMDDILKYTKERSTNVKIVADMFRLDSIDCSLTENATRMNIRIDKDTVVNIPVEAAINMQYSDILRNLKYNKKG